MLKRRSIAIGLAAVLLIAVTFSFPAVRTAASDFLGLFRVQKFAPISISPQQMALLQEVAEGGASPGEMIIRREPGAAVEMGSLREASVTTNVSARTIAALGPAERIYAIDGGDGSLVVDLEGARALVEAAGADPLLLADELDGARVDVLVYPGIQQVWGEDLGADGYMFLQAQSPLVEYPPGLDPLPLGEAVLQVLGLDEREASRIARNIDWAGTMLLPIPREAATFSEVFIDGVNGVALTPITGEGAAVVLWQKDGNIYAFAGPGTVDDLVQLVQQ